MSECRIDFETRSDVDLRKCGTGPYFESEHFRPLGASYRIGVGALRDWEFGEPCPEDLRAHLASGGYVRAFNASFERKCLNWLAENCGWPKVAIDRYRCTAAEAAAMSLPRSLDGVGEALGLAIRKDKEGVRLIRKFSIPRRPRKGEDPNGLYWNEPADHPEDYALFVGYRRQDVLTEEAAAEKIVPLSAYEQQVYTLNEICNDRGVRIDRTSARAALALAEKAKKALDREMREATDGYVPACSQPGKLVEWVQAQGVELPSAAKADIVELLDCDDVPAHVRRALEIRQEAAKTSVAKLQAMLDRASADGRVRGSSMYHAAGTGRFQSSGVNFGNMPRPRRIYDDQKPRSDVLFTTFRSRDPQRLPFLYPETPKPLPLETRDLLLPSQDGVLGRPLHIISDAIRGFIWSAPGHDLIQADYSGIEGAVIAWLAGEDWKVKALHDIIADPSLPDMYRRTAAAILGLPVEEVDKKHWARQAVGKPADLGLGYGGGVSAFLTFARAYGVNLAGVAPKLLAAAIPEHAEKAARRYEGELKRGRSKTDVLSRDVWIACEIAKLGWRAANPAIVGWWRRLEGAACDAVRDPGTVVNAGPADYLVANDFLWCRLPSGRCLAYGAPKLKDQVWAKVKLDDGSWGDDEVMDRDDAERRAVKGFVQITGSSSPKVTALGVNSVTKKWERFALYGGLAAENVTQATARDLLVNGMFKAEAAGYPIIATVYDEIICEVPRGFGSVAEFERIICELPAWADGLPLTAGGWRGKRYRKE